MSAQSLDSNGMAERKNRTLMDKSRALMNEFQLLEYWWREALLNLAMLHKSSISLMLKMKTPHE